MKRILTKVNSSWAVRLSGWAFLLTLMKTVAATLLVMFAINQRAIAQDESAPADPNSMYIPLQPAFVVNFGGVGPLKYLKAEITVRVQDAAAAAAVRHHLPYIRNNLVLLFSRQTDEDLETQIGKEALRQAALEEVRNILEIESKQGGVIDLFFENFIVQK